MKNANEMWLNKSWNNQSNKELCFCVIQDQECFNLTPASLHNLDKVGMNELEIMNLNDCLGKKVGDLPLADTEMLNLLEAKYGILFNGDEKLLFNDDKISLTTLLNKPLNNMLYNQAGEYWYGSSLLYSDSARNYFLTQRAA